MNRITKAILVLTNGNASGAQVSESTRLRLLKAVDVHSENTITITSTGYTVNKKPFLNDNCFPVFESVLAANTLVNEFNIPEKQIIAETFSRDTIGNIYLSFTTILMPLKVKYLKVISSDFHISRVRLICNWIQLLFYPDITIEFIEAIDTPYSTDLKEAVIEKELNAIKSLEATTECISTSEDFVMWFFHQHKAYSHFLSPEKINQLLQKAY